MERLQVVREWLGKTWVQPVILAAWLAVAGGLLATSAPGWWFGAGLALAALVWFRATEAYQVGVGFVTTNFWGKLLLEVLLLAAIVALAVAIVPEAAAGRRPVDHDHTVHYFRAWQLWEDFLSQGTLRGWSNRWFAGYPAQYLYPMGGDLWVLATWALSFGQATLGQAYGFAFFLFWASKGLGGYAFGRVLSGRAVGVILAVLMLTDTAAFRMGGWVFAAQWGVWPQSLSVAMSLLALALLPAIVQGERWLPIAGFGLIGGFALISHPLQLPHLLLVAAIAAFSVALTMQQHRTRALLRMGLAFVVCGCVSAIGMLPFLATNSTTESIGTPWKTATELGTLAIDGRTFEGTLALVTILGILGMIHLLRRGTFLATFTALMGVTLLAASTTDVVADLRLFTLSSSFEFLQYQRFALLAKPYWFAATGCAIVVVVQGLSGEALTRTTARRAALIAFVAGVLAAPFTAGVVRAFIASNVERELTEVEDRSNKAELEEFAVWAHANLPKDDFYRVAWQASRHDHVHVDIGTMVDVPIYKIGYTPAENFQYKVSSANIEVLKAANVRYVVTTRKLGRGYDELTEVGKFKVYELTDPAPFAQVIEGEGDVELVEFHRERFVLQAAEGASGRMRLPVSNFPYWHATRDGVPVKIDTATMKQDDDSGFMAVDLAPGRYVFEFRQSAADHAGDVLFVFGLLLALLLIAFDHPRFRREWPRLQRALDRVEPLYFPAVLAVTFAVVVVAFWLGWRDVPLQDGRRVAFDFTQQLADAKVSREGRRCVWYLDSVSCGHQGWAVVESTAVVFQDNEFERCVWAVPGDKNRPTVVRFPQADLGDATELHGNFGISSGRRGSDVNFVVRVDGDEVAREKLTKDNRRYTLSAQIEGGVRDVEFEITAAKSGHRHFCFHVQALE